MGLNVVEFVEVTQAIGCDPVGIIAVLQDVSGGDGGEA